MRNIILFLFLLPLMAYGQTYKYIGVEDGLSNRRIYNIQKDRQGYMWFLTSEGMDRYNGHDIRHYKLIEANRELSEKQKEKVEKEINYMFYELYTKRMSGEAAKELAKTTYEKVKNEYELGKGHLSLEEEKNLREWIYGGIHEGAEIIKIITDFLPAGKAEKVLKTIKESWNNKGGYSRSVTTQTAE